MAHRGVMSRGVEEDDPHVGGDPLDEVRRQLDHHTQGLEHVRAPAAGREGPVAVLGDAGPGARRNEGGSRGDVERRQAPAAGTAGIRDLGRVSRIDGNHGPAQRPNASSDLVRRVSLGLETHEQGRHLNRRGGAGHEAIERTLGLVRRERFADTDLGDQGSQINCGVGLDGVRIHGAAVVVSGLATRDRLPSRRLNPTPVPTGWPRGRGHCTSTCGFDRFAA